MKTPTWRIHITPLGAHLDPDQRMYDPKNRHGAIRREENFEVEFSANSLTDLARARVEYELVRLALPDEVIQGTVGEAWIRLPGGKMWLGKLSDYLRMLNDIWTEHLKKLVERVEALEKLGKAMPDDAIGQVSIMLKAPRTPPTTKAAD